MSEKRGAERAVIVVKIKPPPERQKSRDCLAHLRPQAQSNTNSFYRAVAPQQKLPETCSGESYIFQRSARGDVATVQYDCFLLGACLWDGTAVFHADWCVSATEFDIRDMQTAVLDEQRTPETTESKTRL